MRTSKQMRMTLEVLERAQDAVRMVRRGRQPSARMRVVSRKMNGLSPIQPRSPPV